MNTHEHDVKTIQEIADNLIELGFIVYLAASKTYGFYTDGTGMKTVSFGLDFGMPKFSGNYKPSRESGTGWGIETPTLPLTRKTALSMLDATAPGWTRNNNPKYTTAEEYMKLWSASKYERYTPQQ